jgi:uncharacterized membrane protein
VTRPLCLILPLALLAGCSKQPVPPIDATAPDAAATAEVEARTSPAAATASASASAAAPAGVPGFPDSFRAIGTEPFWSADVAGHSLTYGTPEFPSGMTITVARKMDAGFVEFSGTLDGKPLTLRIEKGPCSDGMSDRIYPYRATRTIGPDIVPGCARSR